MKTIINTANAPAPIGPYNQAVVAGDFVFVSGQVAINPKTGEKIPVQFVSKSLTRLQLNW